MATEQFNRNESDIQRFMSYVRKLDNGCWEMNTAITPSGYATFWMRGKNWRAHRAAHELFIGPIPNGLTVDHTCHKPTECLIGDGCPHRRCVNTDHLEAVTTQINTMRGHGPKRGISASAKVRKDATHCRRGHKYPDDVYTHKGMRHCRECETFLRVQKTPLRDRSICASGLHAMTPENTRIKNGWKTCRECQRSSQIKMRAKKKLRPGSI